MINRNTFVIQNDLSGPLVVNVEPESIQVSLTPGEKVTVQDSFKKYPVTLKVEADKDEKIISIWPGDGQVRVTKDGVDLLEMIEKRGRPLSRT